MNIVRIVEFVHSVSKWMLYLVMELERNYFIA